MPSEAQINFSQAFCVALEVDGNVHDFAFSDGNSVGGKLLCRIKILWVKTESAQMHLHSHGLNTMLRFDERMFVMRACDVPDGARLYSKDYLDIENQSFEIITARLKDGLWSLTVKILGSN